MGDSGGMEGAEEAEEVEGVMEVREALVLVVRKRDEEFKRHFDELGHWRENIMLFV